MNEARAETATSHAAPSPVYAAASATYATQATPPLDLERLKVTFGCIAFIAIVVLIGFCLGIVGTLLYYMTSAGGNLPLP
jgi:hypothetical protein